MTWSVLHSKIKLMFIFCLYPFNWHYKRNVEVFMF